MNEQEVIKNLKESFKEVDLHQADVAYGEEGLKSDYSFQDPFPPTVGCPCGQTAFHAFTVAEGNGKDDYLYRSKPGGARLWLHDACAVAIYFCGECLTPSARYNQA